MSQYHHLHGTIIGSGSFTWNEDRTMLYAVSVGTGLPDASDELQFTTENTPGKPQQVLPGFLSIMSCDGEWTGLLGWEGPGGYPVGLVHGEQSVTLAQPIPPAGRVTLQRVLQGVYDKGSGALVVIDTEVTLDSGEALGTSRMCLFAQGKGGFGGPRGPADAAAHWDEPARKPDTIISLPVGTNQSLIYRLSGDHREHGTLTRNAQADGFERPVFYGLGSFGVACRALIMGLLGGDAARFGHMSVRMAKPVYPGDRLDALIWRTDEGAQFRLLANGERISLDRGRFRFRQ